MGFQIASHYMVLSKTKIKFSVLFTWFFVPLYLKNSRGIFGEWYREFSEQGEHEDQKMVNTVISRPAAFLYSLTTFSVGISIWWSG